MFINVVSFFTPIVLVALAFVCVEKLIPFLKKRRSALRPPAKSTRWVVEMVTPNHDTEVYNLDGVAWSDAPRPRRFHSCTAQTYGWLGWFTFIQRCACGAINDGGRWRDKNERRSKRRVKV